MLPQFRALEVAEADKRRVCTKRSVTRNDANRSKAAVQHGRGERSRKAPGTRPVRAYRREAIRRTVIPAPNGFRLSRIAFSKGDAGTGRACTARYPSPA